MGEIDSKQMSEFYSISYGEYYGKKKKEGIDSWSKVGKKIGILNILCRDGRTEEGTFEQF